MNKPYSGRTTLHEHKFDDWQNNPVPLDANKGVKKVVFLDAQWSTCPVEVEEQVKDLWRTHENGNDKYIINTNIKQLLEIQADKQKVERRCSQSGKWKLFPLKTDRIVQYLRENGVDDNEQVIIHWWW